MSFNTLSKTADPHRWINLAAKSPSGGNSQPWNIVVEKNEGCFIFTLSISAEYAEKPSVMDLDGSASVVALGTFAFSLQVAAAQDGYILTETNYLNSDSYWDCSVYLRFTPGQSHSLIGPTWLIKRRTHREKLSNERIKSETIDCFRDIAESQSLRFQYFPHPPTSLLKNLYPLEEYRWQNRKFLDSLLSEISFSKTKNPQERKIWVSDLSITPVQKFFLYLVHRFSMLRLFFKLGAAKPVSSDNFYPLIANSGGLIFLSVIQNNFQNIFQFGQALQQIWLLAESQNIGVQPFSQSLVYYNSKKHPLNEEIQQFEKNRFELNAVQISQLHSIDLNHFTLGLRVGYFSD